MGAKAPKKGCLMKTFEIIVSNRNRFKTKIEANTEKEAKEIAQTSKGLDWEDITHDSNEVWIDNIDEI